jgi:NAD(P)H-nitrite reductase large subunit
MNVNTMLYLYQSFGERSYTDGLDRKLGQYCADCVNTKGWADEKKEGGEHRTIGQRTKGQLSYDKLLFATGSSPYIPPEIAGTDASGVFALRTLSDARAMAKRAENTDHAVMPGGGLLNLKAAFALLALGVKVTLVVFSPEVLSQLMEPKDAGLIRNALDKAGLKIMTGRSARSIISDKSGVT